MSTQNNKTNNPFEKDQSVPQEIADKIAKDPIIIYYDKQIDYYERRIANFSPVQMPLFKPKDTIQTD